MSNNYLKFLIVFLFLCTTIRPSFSQSYAGGSGTEEDPYQIETWEHLHNVRSKLNAHFIMNNDLDETTDGYTTYVKDAETLANGGKGWEPIGTSENGFTGVLDGGNNRISALEINRPIDGLIGLFAAIGTNGSDVDGEVKNLNMSKVVITGYQDVGSLAGQAFYGSRIENISIDGSVTGLRYGVGGAVGQNIGTLLNVNARVNVSFVENFTDANVGGLVGENFGNVQKSASNGTVTGYGPVGGLVGLNETNAVITESYATGTVNGTNIVGGLVGENNASITNSYATGDVTGDTVAGFAGLNSGSISNSYSTGFVTPEGGKSSIYGGFIAVFDAGMVSGTYWDTDLSGTSITAGGEGKTTAEMKSMSTFPGWDFDGVWAIKEGASVSTPYLQNAVQEPAPGLVEFFAGGSGTSEDPYQIETWEHLYNIRFAPEAHFQLMNDLTPATNGYTTYVEDENGLVDGGKGWLPIASLTGTLDGSHSEGIFTVSGLKVNRPAVSTGVGLFAELGQTATVKDLIFTDADITGNNGVGVVAGESSGVILRVGASGTVQANSSAGGLVGILTFQTSQTETPSIERSFADVAVTASNDIAGGLVGWVAASNQGAILDAYATGMVTGNEQVGGLIGLLDQSSINRSYATGLVTATDNTSTEVGGFAGGVLDIAQVNITGSFYDTETTGQGYDPATDASIGKTTADMKMRSIFTDAGWDFETIWSIDEAGDPADNDGYPSLQWQGLDDSSPTLSLEAFEAQKLKLYPNPVKSTLHLSTTQSFEGQVEINIYSMLGQKLMALQRQASGSSLEIEVSSLNTGVYILEVISGTQNKQSIKFIKD